jgi:YidC/Oxa1 family membrane protein insertase
VIAANPLRPIEDVLTTVLEWFHTSVGLSWSWSIVALVVAVRILLVPVTVRQIHSMQNLQAHAPEMKEIQQRWKHDRQRQNEELMKFYRENKINPAASCLPILLQIPIFMALFFTLRDFEKEVAANHAASSLEFLGLVDITQPTHEAWGPLLIVIYAISQLTSSYFMSATMQKAQRVLLLVLPIVFIPFIINFPAGLMIYWLTTNLWTTGQGIVTRRLMPRPDFSLKRSSRTPPKEPPKDAGNGAKRKPATPPSTGGAVTAGPPRRVRRKRTGGRRR